MVNPVFLVSIKFLYFALTYLAIERLTVCVTRWWAGGNNAILTEPTSSQENCLKTRRLPPVGCTLCWAHFAGLSLLSFSRFDKTRVYFQHKFHVPFKLTNCTKTQHFQITPLRISTLFWINVDSFSICFRKGHIFFV